MIRGVVLLILLSFCVAVLVPPAAQAKEPGWRPPGEALDRDDRDEGLPWAEPKTSTPETSACAVFPRVVCLFFTEMILEYIVCPNTGTRRQSSENLTSHSITPETQNHEAGRTVSQDRRTSSAR